MTRYLFSWAFPVLLWSNALVALTKLWTQVDIPSEVWGQYPLILIGAVLAGWVFRYWVQNEREWREFTTRQVTEKEGSNLRTLQLIQTNNEQWLKILGDNHQEQIATIERNHQEQLRLQRDSLRETFDANLERILEALSTGYYEQRPNPQQVQKRARRPDET